MRVIVLGAGEMDYSLSQGLVAERLEAFDPVESVTGSLACVANVGPAFGRLGPSGHFAEISDLGKMLLSAVRVLGRLELVPVRVLFFPEFWK